ncbi:MAG: phosphopantetheine-binding protein [bacterium]
MSDAALIDALRALILEAAPDRRRAEPVLELHPDDALNEAIPFDSLIVLGFVVAAEDRFGVRVDRATLARVTAGVPTLRGLAQVIEALRAPA